MAAPTVTDELVKAAVQVVAAYVAARATVHVMREGWQPPPASKAWHLAMRICRRTAETFGRAGMYAEIKYREAVRE